ncbi:hypothetical protein Tco_0802789 [Tanacetum coccineum]|uniref:Uncharacterized protein n=1 Tax=Tanacetum coccineum TaxID=301880 RepID=A0ABQ5A2H6_9ASTR
MGDKRLSLGVQGCKIGTKSSPPNPLIAKYARRNGKKTITYTLKLVTNGHLKWRESPSGERHAYKERLSRNLMKMEYTHDDGNEFVDYSWERAFSIKGEVYPDWFVLGLYEPSDLKHRLFNIHFNKLEINDKGFDYIEYWNRIGEPTTRNKRAITAKDPLMRIVHTIIVGAFVHRTRSAIVPSSGYKIRGSSRGVQDDDDDMSDQMVRSEDCVESGDDMDD